VDGELPANPDGALLLALCELLPPPDPPPHPPETITLAARTIPTGSWRRIVVYIRLDLLTWNRSGERMVRRDIVP